MRVCLNVLDRFEIRVGEYAIDAACWKLRHPKQLLQMVALHPSRQLSREHVLDQLWPDSAAEAANNRLHHTLHVLRTLFADVGVPRDQPVLVLQGDRVTFGSMHEFEIDIKEFRHAIGAARVSTDAAAQAQALRAALALGQPRAPGGAARHEAWLAPYVEEVRNDRLWALERMAALEREAANHASAIDLYQKLVELEPANEIAHRALMEIYEATGNVDRAVYQYAACKRFLQRDLAAQASQATQALMHRIVARARAAQAARTAAPAPAGATRVPRYVAPPHAIELLGREHDLTTLTDWIVRDHSRLITICGTAGLGKTRVAQVLAERCQDHFADGVLALGLTELQRGEQLTEAVRAALGAGDAAGCAASSSMHLVLARRSVMVLLDRFEHLVDAAALLPQWLEAAPGLTLVITSQRPLCCAGERVYELSTLLESGGSAAVDLFLRTAANVGVALDPSADTPLAAAIAERLAGNPLAIELAAAQTQLLSLPQVMKSLDHPLDLLTNPTRDVERPQRSLRDAIAWSHALLSPSDRDVFRALQVFTAPFTCADAVVCLARCFAPQAVRGAIDALLQLQLLSRTGAGESPAQRLTMLDAVRQFVLELPLAGEQAQALRAGHAAHAVALMRVGMYRVAQGCNDGAIAEFTARRTDFFAAVRWLASNAEPLQFLRAVRDFSGLASIAGAVSDSVTLLEEGVRIGERGGAAEQRLAAWCAYRVSRACSWLNDRTRETRSIRRARQLAAACGDSALSDEIVKQLAVLRLNQGRFRTALHHLEPLMARHEASGDHKALVAGYGHLVAIRFGQGKGRAALAAAERCLDCALALQDPRRIGYAMTVLAEAQARVGRVDQARQTLDEAAAMPAGSFSALRTIHMRMVDAFIDYERLELDAAQAKIALLRAQLDVPEREASRVFLDICADLIAIEGGGPVRLSMLDRADFTALPDNLDFSNVVVSALGYRVRLLAERGHWQRCGEAVRELSSRLSRSPNLLWHSMAYECCAHAVALTSDRTLTRRLLTLSKAMVRRAAVKPTPRQQRSWLAIENAMRGSASPAQSAALGSVDEIVRRMSELMQPHVAANASAPTEHRYGAAAA
jgi:predicted ATPase/DNA-binding SARP family transcriptional activator